MKMAILPAAGWTQSIGFSCVYMQTIKIRFSRHVLIGAPCYFGSILYIHEVWRTPSRVSLHMPCCCASTRRVIKSLLGILSRFASHKSQTIFGSDFVGTNFAFLWVASRSYCSWDFAPIWDIHFSLERICGPHSRDNEVSEYTTFRLEKPLSLRWSSCMHVRMYLDANRTGCCHA